MKINHIKLLEQDPEFADYCKEIYLALILSDQKARGAVMLFHSLYQADISVDQAIEINKRTLLMMQDIAND